MAAHRRDDPDPIVAGESQDEGRIIFASHCHNSLLAEERRPCHEPGNCQIYRIIFDACAVWSPRLTLRSINPGGSKPFLLQGIIQRCRPASPRAASGQGAMLESISDYYRRRADQERECAEKAVDVDLRRIHLDKAATMERRAEEARLQP
jgi:hypothetical protein